MNKGKKVRDVGEKNLKKLKKEINGEIKNGKRGNDKIEIMEINVEKWSVEIEKIEIYDVKVREGIVKMIKEIVRILNRIKIGGFKEMIENRIGDEEGVRKKIKKGKERIEIDEDRNEKRSDGNSGKNRKEWFWKVYKEFEKEDLLIEIRGEFNEKMKWNYWW